MKYWRRDSVLGKKFTFKSGDSILFKKNNISRKNVNYKKVHVMIQIYYARIY